MTDQPSIPPEEDRRRAPRHPGSAQALVLRDSDVMRTGINASLRDISVAGIGILIATQLEVDEQIKVRLTNAVQHVDLQVRGFVRHVTSVGEGEFFVGVELLSRLTPLDVSLLKMGVARDAEQDGPVWM